MLTCERAVGHEMDTIAVPLQPQEIQAVRRIAESQGIDYVALLQGWVLEKIRSS